MGNGPPTTASFRLVKYDNSPRRRLARGGRPRGEPQRGLSGPRSNTAKESARHRKDRRRRTWARLVVLKPVERTQENIHKAKTILAGHHSAQRQSRVGWPMEPWRCAQCSILNKAKATYCQRCGSRWDVTTEAWKTLAARSSQRPKSPRKRSQSQRTRATSAHQQTPGTEWWDSAYSTYQIKHAPPPPWATGQAAKGPHKGKGKGKGKPQPEAKGGPSGPSWPSWPVASLPSWPPKEEHQPPEQQQQLSAILAEVKKLPEDSIPESLRQALRDAEAQGTRDIHKRTTELGNAKKHLENMQAAYSSRLKAWEGYLSESINTWQLHIKQFVEEEENFMEQYQAAEESLKKAKQGLKDATAEVAEIGEPSEESKDNVMDTQQEMADTASMAAFKAKGAKVKESMSQLLQAAKEQEGMVQAGKGEKEKYERERSPRGKHAEKPEEPGTLF